MDTFDVAALGEVLIDFTPNGENEQGVVLFACNPGGAAANVLAMNARLGGKTAFIGKVGKDAFGDFLRRTLSNSGIDATGLVTDENIPTTLAFVQLDENGDRSFTFYRKPGADILLNTSDLKWELIEKCGIFHFGSVSLTENPSRAASFAAAAHARRLGKIISFDPNFRSQLWNSESDAREQMAKGVSMADLLKVSNEEMTLLTGETDIERGSEKLSAMGPALVLVTLGCKGAFYRNSACFGHLPTYDVATLDTTGAGDAFMGAVHFRVKGKTRKELEDMPQPELTDIVDFANAAGSLATTHGGAIPAMPAMDEIRHCRQTTSFLRTQFV